MASKEKNENGLQGNEQSSEMIAQQSNAIIDMAKQEIAQNENQESDGNGVLGDDNVVGKFRGLPMRDLIAAPLIAAAEAQEKLATVAWDFYEKIAFDDKKTRTLDFTIQRPIEETGQMTMTEQKVSAPFIGLVPIPSLLIDHMDVDFQMEVTDTTTQKSKKESSLETKAKASWWVVSAEVTGKVTSSVENTRNTNQTAKYQVHVSASQQPPTEGLSKLMDIMASCITPISTKK